MSWKRVDPNGHDVPGLPIAISTQCSFVRPTMLPSNSFGNVTDSFYFFSLFFFFNRYVMPTHVTIEIFSFFECICTNKLYKFKSKRTDQELRVLEKSNQLNRLNGRSNFWNFCFL